FAGSTKDSSTSAGCASKMEVRPPSGMRCWRQRKMSPVEGRRWPGLYLHQNHLANNAAQMLRPNGAAWYRKQEPTFSDAIAAVRRALWCPPDFSMSRQGSDTVIMPVALLNRFVQTLCLAA